MKKACHAVKSLTGRAFREGLTLSHNPCAAEFRRKRETPGRAGSLAARAAVLCKRRRYSDKIQVAVPGSTDNRHCPTQRGERKAPPDKPEEADAKHMKIKVLVIGGGGREHALAWKISESPIVEKENVAIGVDDIDGLARFAKSNGIDLTVVGPEGPLVAGVTDRFQKDGLRIFGPTAAAAELEGSKSFTKDFLSRHNIPTAKYETFTDEDKAVAYIEKHGAPVVVKADGLAAGKGVIVAMDTETAVSAARDMLSGNKFGSAGSRIVVEDYLDGEEASFIVMTDGVNILPMATSQDHKRVGDGDTGPNTGGMGAYSPAPVVTKDVYEKVMSRIITPTVRGMAGEGRKYVGFLYAGLMIDKNGDPKVIEFNCRFGDPETQPIMLRMNSDLAALCYAACEGDLGGKLVSYDVRPAVGVVLAAEGYPASPRKGDVISGLDTPLPKGTKIFQAGTKEADGKVVTNGGRVLCVTALGNTVKEARDNAYALAEKISWNGMFCRHDIAHRAIEREEAGKI